MWFKLLVLLFCTASVFAGDKKNVLLIAVDDLRARFGESYDFSYVKTPNIDRLATMGTVFKQAYAQTATCGVSRSSLLTGRRPDTTGVLSNNQCFYKTGGNWTSLPHYFRDNGYFTFGSGKIFHPGVCDGLAHGEDRAAWDGYYHSPCPGHGSYPCEDAENEPRPFGWMANTTATDVETPDGMIAAQIRDMLRNVTSQSQPWFLALGQHKPHLPLVAPSKYFDMYPLDTVPKLNDTNKHVPQNIPEVAWNSCGEIRSYDDISSASPGFGERTPFPDSLAQTLRQAYFAATTFTDMQIGTVLNEMESLGVLNSTVILLFGDHGWALGNNNEWAKHMEFVSATRAPLIVVSPEHVPGQVSTSWTEFVDIYPTLAQLAGLGVPSLCPPNSTDVHVCTEGASLVPLLEDPKSSIKNASFTQWPKGDVMGCSIHNGVFRYTEWVDYDKQERKPNWDKSHGVELYDHSVDPEENVNVAGQSSYADKQAVLRDMLHAGWRHAIL